MSNILFLLPQALTMRDLGSLLWTIAAIVKRKLCRSRKLCRLTNWGAGLHQHHHHSHLFTSTLARPSSISRHQYIKGRVNQPESLGLQHMHQTKWSARKQSLESSRTFPGCGMPDAPNELFCSGRRIRPEKAHVVIGRPPQSP